MRHERDSRRPESPGRSLDGGFSLIEVLIVIMLIAIVSAMAVPVASGFLQSHNADSSLVATQRAITAARDRAIAERRNIQLDFIIPNRIRHSRVEVPGGALTTVAEFTLENGQALLKFADVPDTPDAFGADSYAAFGGVSPVMFTSDGSLIDAAGDVVNGSIYVGMAGQPDTQRAVTIFGVSGLTRAWKWRGQQWME